MFFRESRLYGGTESFIVLSVSSVVNLMFSKLIEKAEKNRILLLRISVIANICLLLFYKYCIDFIIDGNKAMPLGISFFTFQQIMYVVNVYKKEIPKVDTIDYLAYILYFPKLVMGPITEPVHLIKQFDESSVKMIDWDSIAGGIKMFCFGLFKKMILADTFSKAVTWGFANIGTATSADIFIIMLSYSFEIYFDFSGYSDMAVGISEMINIKLPMNFNSPYKALSIRDFWKRWHISLTGFFTRYIYYPLGGNRKGRLRTYINIMFVFLVSGLWHGNNFTFLLWGGLYGVLQVIERATDKYYKMTPKCVKWIYSFLTVNLLWLLFRSESIRQWLSLLRRMFSFESLSISAGLKNLFMLPEIHGIFNILSLDIVNIPIYGLSMFIFLISAFAICIVPENNYIAKSKHNLIDMVFAAFAFVWAFLCLSSESVFVYFNF